MNSTVNDTSFIQQAVDAITGFRARSEPVKLVQDQCRSRVPCAESGQPNLQEPYPKVNRSHVTDSRVGQQDSREENLSTRLDDAVSTNLLPKTTSIVGQIPPKATLFERPVSFHDDTSGGFVFGKAKPAQLDFSRRPLPKTDLPDPRDLPGIKPNTDGDSNHRSSLILSLKANEANPSDNSVSGKSGQPSSPTDPPLPLQATGLEIEQSTPMNASDDTRTLTARRSPYESTNTFADETIEESRTNQSKNTETLPLSHQSSAATEVMGPTIPSQSSSQHVLSKSGKVPRKSQPTVSSKTTRAPQVRSTRLPPNDEDPLNLMLLCYRRGQQERETAREIQNAQAIEVQDLRDVSSTLFQQLQDVRRREQLQAAELTRVHAIVPKWEARIKQLSKHVKELADDHLKLHDDAQEIRAQQQHIHVDKVKLDSTLKDVQNIIEQDRNKVQKTFTEARHHLQMLEQTVDNQEIQLQEDADLLNVERDRSQRLEDEIQKMTSNHQHIVKLLTGHREIITDKLDELLNKEEAVHTVTPPQSQDYIKPMLDQVLGLLQGLENTDVARPDDLLKLGSSLMCHVDRVTESLQASCSTTAGLEVGQREFIVELQKQLQALSDTITTERTMAEQVASLREMKAIIRERLQGTENSLVETRQQVIAFQCREQAQNQQISTLEIEGAKLRESATAPLTILRLHELETENRDLQKRYVSLEKHAAEVMEQLQKKAEEALSTKLSTDRIQTLLDESRSESVTLKKQRVIYETQSLANFEERRRQLSKAADVEKTRVETFHREQLQRLEGDKEEVETKLSQIIEQLARLELEKNAAETVAEQTLTVVKQLQIERKGEMEASARLQSRQASLERQSDEIDRCQAQAQENLSNVYKEVEKKDAEIRHLTTLIASKKNAVPITSPIPRRSEHKPKRKANRGTKQTLVILEDSQPMEPQPLAITSRPVSAQGEPMTAFSYFQQDEPILMSSPSSSCGPLKEIASLFPPTPTREYRVLSSPRNIRVNSTSKVLFNQQIEGWNEHTSSASGIRKKPVEAQEQSWPRGILKDPKIDKRTAISAGHDAANPLAASKRARTTESLGPIIPDSQSPRGSRIPARNRRLSTVATRKPTKGKILFKVNFSAHRDGSDDKYTRRFTQELQ